MTELKRPWVYTYRTTYGLTLDIVAVHRADAERKVRDELAARRRDTKGVNLLRCRPKRG